MSVLSGRVSLIPCDVVLSLSTLQPSTLLMHMAQVNMLFFQDLPQDMCHCKQDFVCTGHDHAHDHDHGHKHEEREEVEKKAITDEGDDAEKSRFIEALIKVSCSPHLFSYFFITWPLNLTSCP